MRVRHLAVSLALLVLLTAARPATAAEPFADVILTNGKIITADTKDVNGYRTVQAVAIRNGKFHVVGTNAEALAYAGSLTKKIDLAGRTVIPGLVETHDHINEYAAHFFPSRRSDEDAAIAWKSRDEGL